MILSPLITDPHAHSLARMVCRDFRTHLPEPSQTTTTLETLALYAAHHGAAPLLTWALPAGVIATLDTMREALHSGHYDMVFDQFDRMDALRSNCECARYSLAKLAQFVVLPDGLGHTILMELARSGDIARTQWALDKGYQILEHLDQSTVRRALCKAAKHGRLAWIRWFWHLVSPNGTLPLPFDKMDPRATGQRAYLQFLREFEALNLELGGGPLNYYNIEIVAAHGGYMDIVTWAVEHMETDEYEFISHEKFLCVAARGINLRSVLEDCYFCHPHHVYGTPLCAFKIWFVVTSHPTHSAELTLCLLKHYHDHHCTQPGHTPVTTYIQSHVCTPGVTFVPGPALNRLVAWITDVAKYPIGIDIYQLAIERGALAACRSMWPTVRPMLSVIAREVSHSIALHAAVKRGDEAMMEWITETVAIQPEEMEYYTMPDRDLTMGHAAHIAYITRLEDFLITHGLISDCDSLHDHYRPPCNVPAHDAERYWRRRLHGKVSSTIIG